MLATLCALLLTAPADLVWLKSVEEAQARAAAEKKVVFVAVNMDGEKANERMLAKVYTDKAVLGLAAHTLNLIASVAEHAADGKPCPKFAGLTCLDHRRSDSTLRRDVLKADTAGFVVAPQHVFLGPDGKVLLSVPYEVSASELAWCFAAALKAVDPATTLTAPPGARPPKRLIAGGVHDPSVAGGRMLTRKEALELISELKKSGRANWETEQLRALVACDEPEAREFIELELRSGGGGGRGGGGGGGGRGGGGGLAGGGMGGDGGKRHEKIMHEIGIESPAAWWTVAAEFLGDSNALLRAECAVALEQIAAPEALKALQKALQEEELPGIRKDILRALGSVGAQDTAVRTLLLKKARSEKDELLRLNSIAALGSLAAHEDVQAELTRLLGAVSGPERQAAACAMALSRDERYLPALEAAAADARDPELVAVAKAALQVIRSGELKPIQADLKRVCKDTLDRERFFGRKRD